jgi:hypothetical protein
MESQTVTGSGKFMIVLYSVRRVRLGSFYGHISTFVCHEDGRGHQTSGDEFAVATSDTALKVPVEQFAERIVGAFDTPLLTGTRQHCVKVSVGVAAYPGGGRSAEELLSNGHLAFCRAKAIRRGSHVVFESAIRDELEQRLTLEAELARIPHRIECIGAANQRKLLCRNNLSPTHGYGMRRSIVRAMRGLRGDQEEKLSPTTGPTVRNQPPLGSRRFDRPVEQRVRAFSEE